MAAIDHRASILAMQLRSTLGAGLVLVLLASMLVPCFDVCPDEARGKSCPPVCASCIGCARSPVPVPVIDHELGAPDELGLTTAPSTTDVLPLLADDILHVPLSAAC